MSTTLEKYLQTGIGEIDDHHVAIMEYFGDMFDLILANDSREKLKSTLEFLDRIVKEHFQSEEAAMREHSFHNYAYHKAQHDSFIEYFERVKDSFGEKGRTSELDRQNLFYFYHWLHNHIQSLDQELALFLRRTRDRRQKVKSGSDRSESRPAALH